MNDELLLSEIKKNPSKGFDLLLNEYSAFVFRVCLAVLGSAGTKEDAQECASDVFAVFYKNLNFRAPGASCKSRSFAKRDSISNWSIASDIFFD